MTQTQRYATYKGKTYRLEWIGDTKFGRRAKLAFCDGSKEFWVDASLVTEAGGSTTSPYNGRNRFDGHKCRNGHAPHPGPCCSGRHGAGYDCGCDCCELD